MKKSGFIATIPLLAFACGAFIEARKLPFGSLSSPRAGFFPLILSALLAVFSLPLLLESLKEREARSGLRPGTWKRVGLTLGALFAYGFLFESLGYIVTTFLFVGFLLRAVDRQGWLRAFTVAFCASLASYLLFGLLLRSPLPAGILRL